MQLLGYDIGSSSVKASIIEAETGKLLASAFSPKREFEIISKQPGWAEQHPSVWWEHLKNATQEITSKATINVNEIKAIGISYQMHGLVVVDKNQEILRPSILWCDSRAVEIGNKALQNIGSKKSMEHLLNSPGNFTASKLKWVKENEPELFKKIYKIMLPGDYIAMKMSGKISTTATGLSEGMLWDYKEQDIAKIVLEEYEISKDLLPDLVPGFGVQAELSAAAAKELGLPPGIKIAYRAGDQPNNAFSLNVLNKGEVAATAGTSGVIYGVSELAKYDEQSRVNTFLHVNNTPKDPKYGVLLCINGTGSLNGWLKNNVLGLSKDFSYSQMNNIASQAPVGSDGLVILPFGNGAERILGNKDIGAQLCNARFNNHTLSHILRAAQEGIVFSLNYGLDIMRNLGVRSNTIKAGYANMFLSPIFSNAFATLTGAVVELYNTDGSQGAARAAGFGAGIYKNIKESFHGLNTVSKIEPDLSQKQKYEEAYQNWLTVLNKTL